MDGEDAWRALGVSGLANLKPNIERRQADAAEFAEKLRGQFKGFELRPNAATDGK